MVKGALKNMVHSKKAPVRLGFKAVRNGRFDEHLDLLKNGNNPYPELVIALQQISWQEFEELFYRVGEVTAIYRGSENAGFYWVEERGRILYLHSLVIKDEYRGQGISREVFKRLENSYRGSLDAIEVGLHESNQHGLAFYQNVGFEKWEIIDDIGFIILRKSLIGES